MRKLDVVVISLALGVLYLAVSWPVHSDKAQDFLVSLEEGVKAIAERASQNYNNSCGLVDTCQSEQNCSRRECFLLEGQGHKYSCVYAHNVAKCKSHANSQCNRLKADFSRSMIRLPGNKTMQLPSADNETVASTFGSTICTQRSLDATFASLKFSYSNETVFYNLFFGAADGVFRFFPAREILTYNCNTYDPRIRPWYNGAISVKKNVVLLLDTGSAMAEDTQFFSTISPLDTVKNVIRNLGRTLTPQDTFTLISVNSSGALLLKDPYRVSANLSETDEFLIELLDNPALNDVESHSVAPSDFKAGFSLANATSPPPNTTGDALKIILLLTDSNNGNLPSTDIVNSTLAPLKNQGVGLFVFDLTPGNASTLWDTAPCRASSETTGQQYLFTAQQNPLLLLNPYFSFLARARIEANKGSTVFYSKPFNSSSNLGSVIGVSYLAMSKDNTVLVGVAGMDVQTGGLLTDLQNALEIALASDNFRRSTSIPALSTFVDPITCSAEYVKNCPGAQEGSFRPICYSSEEPSSEDELESLLCCKGKGCSAGHHHGAHIWIILATAGGTLVAVTVMVFLIVCIIRATRRKRRHKCSPLSILYKDLRHATNRFDPQNIIGEGAFGVVYKGRLGEMDVAVKHLKRTPDKLRDFQDELRLNMTIPNHPNLVVLEGACFRDGDFYLVYQFVGGGDLHRWLWPEPESLHREASPVLFLTWNKRRQIARGIAQGLDHLHRGLPSGQIYHLDLKPRNILLDENFTPKIADFGISQLYEPGRTYNINAITAGSFGYVAPEVFNGNQLPNSKIDVFSYGVVLLQLVSGRRIDAVETRPFFHSWARQLAERDAMDELIDEYLFESVQPESLQNLVANCRKMVKIALLCTEEDPDLRPEMVHILDSLNDFLDVQELELPSSSDDDENPERKRSTNLGMTQDAGESVGLGA